jgi:molybdopterin/thiamine biosynthesis adenylyltransferase
MKDLHAILVGAGNIGSHLASHLVRLGGLARLTIIDRDRYEASNLATQAIELCDLGQPKAEVLARRVSGIRPSLVVEPIVAPLEQVPIGRLRADLLLTCLDSRSARQHANEVAWHTGVPCWIDSGVRASPQMVRVTRYHPGDGEACLECSWSDAEYGLLPAEYHCDGSAAEQPTGAPAALGGLAAALQALECQRFLNGEAEEADEPGQLAYFVGARRVVPARFVLNRSCRFDHARWTFEEVNRGPGELTLGEMLKLAGGRARVPHARLALRLRCPECGAQRERLAVLDHMSTPAPRCAHCGTALIAGAFDRVDELDASALGPEDLARPLAELGLTAGDGFLAGTRCLVVGGRSGNPERT